MSENEEKKKEYLSVSFRTGIDYSDKISDMCHQLGLSVNKMAKMLLLDYAEEKDVKYKTSHVMCLHPTNLGSMPDGRRGIAMPKRYDGFSWIEEEEVVLSTIDPKSIHTSERGQVNYEDFDLAKLGEDAVFMPNKEYIKQQVGLRSFVPMYWKETGTWMDSRQELLGPLRRQALFRLNTSFFNLQNKIFTSDPWVEIGEKLVLKTRCLTLPPKQLDLFMKTPESKKVRVVFDFSFIEGFALLSNRYYTSKKRYKYQRIKNSISWFYDDDILLQKTLQSCFNSVQQNLTKALLPSTIHFNTKDFKEPYKTIHSQDIVLNVHRFDGSREEALETALCLHSELKNAISPSISVAIKDKDDADAVQIDPWNLLRTLHSSDLETIQEAREWDARHGGEVGIIVEPSSYSSFPTESGYGNKCSIGGTSLFEYMNMKED